MVVWFFIWFWLAISISGSSQVVRISSGEDNGSVKNIGENPRLSLFCEMRKSEIKLIIKL